MANIFLKSNTQFFSGKQQLQHTNNHFTECIYVNTN